MPASPRRTPKRLPGPRPLAAEFFAGIGLVRKALEESGFDVAFANDIEPFKRDLYAANFDARDFVLADLRDLRGKHIPTVQVATASFPCTDLSLAGWRRGLRGNESALFWEFARILREMGRRRPGLVCVENVPSFATSQGGDDLALAVDALNRLGYACDLLIVDARLFVPQSRPRLFIVGSRERFGWSSDWRPSPIRPPWIERFVAAHPELRLQALPLAPPYNKVGTLAHVVERPPPDDQSWWDAARLERFVHSLSEIQAERLERLRARRSVAWATAYRRTRYGRAVWEIRADAISGCLRTARGGSSKQAVVEAGRDEIRVRWMTSREYATLQGAADYEMAGARDSQILWGFGDAVCVPVVSWIAREYLRPLALGELTIARPKRLAQVA